MRFGVNFILQVNEHQGKINDICFCDKKETIYSGSNDKFVIEWSYPLMTVKRYVVAIKYAVEAVVAGAKIRWHW